MARIATCGFEWGDNYTISIEGSTTLGGAATGTVVADTGTVRSGSKSAKVTAVATNDTVALDSIGNSPGNQTAATTAFVRCCFNLSTLPATNARLFQYGSNSVGFTANIGIRVTSAGKIQLWNESAGTQIGSDAAATVATGTWFRLELSVTVDGSTNITACEGRLDGVTVASTSGLSISAIGSSAFVVGWCTTPAIASAVLYLDDYAYNDSTGANQNSWPGDGKVVLLIPISDNAVGAGWTLGTGTAISGGSGSTAVKNKPPLGVADLAAGSDTKLFRNATANANSNYDANLTTYTTAGVGASDTINVLVPIVFTAAPVSTSAKQGTVGIVSNPAIANIALGLGGTTGAFWFGTAGGTYNTGWKYSTGTTTYAPSVTLGTSPVMRITQVTSSTRIAVVCFMVMYVDYTPAAAAAATQIPNVVMAPYTPA